MKYKHMHLRGVTEQDHYAAYKLFFGTFASEQRLRILNLLREQEMNVSELQKATGYEQSTISHNLGRLKNCGFVVSESRGRHRYYSLNKKTLRRILDLIDKHMEDHCLRIIKRLKGN